MFLINKLMEKGKWDVEKEVNVMWHKMTECIRKVAKDVL